MLVLASGISTANASTPIPIQLEGIHDVSLGLDISGPAAPDEHSVRRLKSGGELLAQLLAEYGTRVRDDATDAVEVKIFVQKHDQRCWVSAYASVSRHGLVRIAPNTFRQFSVIVWLDTYRDDGDCRGLDEIVTSTLRYFGSEIGMSLKSAREYSGRN